MDMALNSKKGGTMFEKMAGKLEILKKAGKSENI